MIKKLYQVTDKTKLSTVQFFDPISVEKCATRICSQKIPNQLPK